MWNCTHRFSMHAQVIKVMIVVISATHKPHNYDDEVGLLCQNCLCRPFARWAALSHFVHRRSGASLHILLSTNWLKLNISVFIPYSIGVARGGPRVPMTPPFWMPFLTKQPTTGGENAMTISWLLLKSPFLKLCFWIKVLMRSSTPLPLVIHADFYLKIFWKMSSEKWNFWRLSVYELARNEIFLWHWSSGDWN